MAQRIINGEQYEAFVIKGDVNGGPVPVDIQGATLELDRRWHRDQERQRQPNPGGYRPRDPRARLHRLELHRQQPDRRGVQDRRLWWHHGGDADLGVRRQRQPDLRHQELSHGSQVQPIYRQP
jgi:hypothetical protein